MDYNSKYTGEQVEELLDKINGSPEDIAIPTGNYPDMTVGKASQADTATIAINADNATKAASATTADRATQATTADKATTADYATTAGQATTAESAKTATNADRATTAEYATTAGVAESAEHATTAESATHAGAATKADFATDLTGRNEATAEEFAYRPSAGNISIRDDSATIKRIKGNSIVWNQMCDFTNGVFTFGESSGIKDTEGYTITTNESNTTATIFQFGSPIPFYSHKWLAIATIKSPIKVNIKGMPTQGFVPNTKCDIYSLYQSAENNWYWGLTIESVGTISEIKVYNYLLFDLTQMFGAGNEPDTVEEFRALFPGNHYEYNPGQLVSMTANGLFTNGFNQWDEQWKVGQISSTTGNVVVAGGNKIKKIISKNYIPVLPNTSYFLTLPLPQDDSHGVYYYDGNKNYIGYLWIAKDVNQQLFTTPSNCLFIKFDSWGTTYNNNICINLSHTGVENGKYEPYWDATKDLSIIQKYFPNGMRSAGSIYDEISFDETIQKWVAIQRVGNVDLGSLSWAYSEHLFSGETVAGFKTSIEDIIFANTATTLPNITVSKYNINTADKVANGYAATETFTGYKAYKTDLSAYFTFTTDASEFKSSLSGVMLNYELAEPIITVIEEPINLSYKVGDFGIEQILSDSFSAPFRADIIYQFNATDRIRENSLNIEKLSKTQKDYLPLTGGTMSGQINSQDIKPVEDNTYQLGDSTHKYKNVFSDFFTGNLEGNAKTASDLTGRVEATPEVFTYRPSAGDKSIKDDNAFIRRVKGNSVVWNQLVNGSEYSNTQTQYGLQCSVTSNSREIRVVGTYAGDTSVPDRNLYTAGALTYHTTGIVGHKYLCHISGNKECSLTVYGWCSGSTDIFDSIIKECTSNQQLTMAIKLPLVADGTQIDETIIIDIHDLTAMFGTGNEPTTVEEFRALYPDSYYPYNAGELRNLVCSGIKTVGFNQWDEQWEAGTLNGVGENDDTSTTIRSKNYTPAIGNADYYVGITSEGYDNIYYLGISWYDSNKQFISKTYCNQRVVTSPINAAYFRIFTNTNSYVYGNTYNNDICINLHHTGYRDGEYEPYKEVTHSLPLSQITNGEPLRKAGSVYDEINETEYIRRVGVVDLGSLGWSVNDASKNVFWTATKITDATVFGYSAQPNLTCRIDVLPFSEINLGIEKFSISLHNAQKRVVVCAPNFETTEAGIAALKASLSGVLLHYELAEPIVTPITTPIDFNYYVEDFGTEEAILAEDSAPFSADIVYQFNATDQIRNNTHNIQKLQKSAFTPSGTSAQYIRGDGSYGDIVELSQSTPINNGEFETTDEGDMQFILTPNYYAKSQVTLDNTTTIAVFVTAPENSYYLAEYWFEFAVDDTLPNIEYYQPNNSKAVFRIDGDMMTDAVNILHLISSDGGNTFFGEIRSYSL